MLKRKLVVEPTFWRKDAFHIVPHGYKSFKALREEFPDIRVIFIKQCTPLAICKELVTDHNWQTNTSDYYLVDDELKMDEETCTTIKKFQITIEGKQIRWNGIHFVHRETALCDDCFIVGVLTPKYGCLTHIPKCDHGIKLNAGCSYCYARSFASFWLDIVNCIQTTQNLLFIFKQSAKKYDFECFTCKHTFASALNDICNRKWCPFCGNRRLCGNIECAICYNKSFMSFEYAKRDCIQTSKSLLLIFKQSNQKYDFKCFTCAHTFTSRLDDIFNGQWCPFCSNRKLCGKSNCTICYEKSFMSFDNAKRDCIRTEESMSLIFKQSNKKYNFVCCTCNHCFLKKLQDVSNGHWCPFCTNKKLCGKVECKTCYNKSFASFEPVVKRDCLQTKESLLLIFKHSHKKYDFKCYKCAHTFTAILGNISAGWCRYCIGHVCGNEDCLKCAKQCIMAKCSKRAQKQTRITKNWYCDEHFNDCISRDPAETPLIYRAKISIEIYTLAELQRLSMQDLEDARNFFWANPTSWDCKLIPGVPFKPDNLFCFDKNFDLLPFADDQSLNLSKLGYAIMVEILEEGRYQHSKARSISDESREIQIRAPFDAYQVPLGCLYVSMAHNKHFSPHPDDVFFHKISNGEYELIPSRSSAFHARIKDIQDTLNLLFNAKMNSTIWIGH